MNSKIRERMRFTGRVQGVGFRYRLSYLSDAFGVTGWVRNEYDGSVLAELQGFKEELDQIIKRLGQDRYIEIDEVRRKEIPVEEEEHGFDVRG